MNLEWMNANSHLCKSLLITKSTCTWHMYLYSIVDYAFDCVAVLAHFYSSSTLCLTENICIMMNVHENVLLLVKAKPPFHCERGWLPWHECLAVHQHLCLDPLPPPPPLASSSSITSSLWRCRVFITWILQWKQWRYTKWRVLFWYVSIILWWRNEQW